MTADLDTKGRNGPRVQLSCIGCNHYEQERFRVQGDEGYHKWCLHSGERRSLRQSYTDITPDWCPYLPQIAGPDEVVVPREPTEAMIRAGMSAVHKTCDITPNELERAYRSMTEPAETDDG